jgi:catechol 2,3-dioxygenase
MRQDDIIPSKNLYIIIETLVKDTMAEAFKTKIGHAHLKVRDIKRSIDFYVNFLGLNVTEVVGNHYAFLTAGTYHHDIALQNVGSDAPKPLARGTGLYHIAFEVPDKRSFALAYRALQEAGISAVAVDHYISWAMYFDDPDGNGLEIYCDTRTQPGGRQLWHGDNAPLEKETILAALAE